MKELSPRERGRLWLRLALRLGLWLLGLWALLRLGPTALSLFAPFLLAFFTAWALSPAVKWLHTRLGLSRKLAALVLILLVFALLGAGVWWLVSAAVGEWEALAESWEELLGGLQDLSRRLDEGFSRGMKGLPAAARDAVQALGDRFFSWLETAVPRLLSAGVDAAAGFARSLPSFAVAAVAFVTASYFLAADAPRLRSTLAHQLPSGPRYFLSLLHRASAAGLGGYLKAEFFLSVGVFFLLLGGFLLIHQPYALLLAFALAVLDFLPIFGAGTVMVPWALVELLFGDFRQGVGLGAVWGTIALFRRLAEPKALGDQTGLSPLASLMAVYVGMRAAGVLGMLLGPILCMVARSLIRSGILDNTLRDLRLAFEDLSAFLGSGDEA